MTLIRTSDGSLWDIVLPTQPEDFERLDIHTVRLQDGTLTKPPVDIYAELLAVQHAHFNIAFANNGDGALYFAEKAGEA